MVKTGNRIFKKSVRKFTTNQNSSSFYSLFFKQCTFNSDPEPELFHFLPDNIKHVFREPVHISLLCTERLPHNALTS